MKIIAVAVAACLLAGCASSPSSEVPASLAGRGKCKADASPWAIGQPANEENGRRLFKESGAGLWRIVGPDQAVRKDYRDDRLNVNVDAANLITSISCG